MIYTNDFGMATRSYLFLAHSNIFMEDFEERLIFTMDLPHEGDTMVIWDHDLENLNVLP